MKNFNISFASTFLSIASLSACGPVNDMHDATMDMNKKMTSLVDNMSSMHDTMKGMNTNIEGMHSDMKSMSGQMTTMNNSIDGMHTDMKSMTGYVSTMAGKMDTMSDQMGGVSGQMKTISGQMNTMNGSITDMHTDMKSMTGYVSSMAGKMDTMSNQMGGVAGQMTTISGQMNTMNTSIGGMHSDMSSMTKDVHTMAGQMETMNASIDSMHTDMSAMTGAVTVMSGQMGTMNTSIDDMHSDMKDMAKDVHGLADYMDKMNGSVQAMTTQMASLTGDIKKMGITLDLTHADLRMIFTGQHRIESLNAMEKANNQMTRLGYAGEYMISHTYQSWNVTVDSKETRTDLMGIATPDFFYKVNNYIKDRSDVDPTHTDDNSQNLYALTAALDFVNLIELQGLRGSDEKIVTMLSMIEDGLKQLAPLKSGEVRKTDIPTYQREVMARADDAIYLLRVRQNFLKGVIYNLLKARADGDDPSKWQSIINVIKTRGLGMHIDPNLANKNAIEIDVVTAVVNTAIESEQFLRSLGVDPMNNKNVAALLRKMRLGNAGLPGCEKEIQGLNEALQRLVSLSN